jgi:hypothetical protein
LCTTTQFLRLYYIMGLSLSSVCRQFRCHNFSTCWPSEMLTQRYTLFINLFKMQQKPETPIFVAWSIFAWLGFRFNATFNNIAVILWSVLLMVESGVPGETTDLSQVTSHWQTLSYDDGCFKFHNSQFLL